MNTDKEVLVGGEVTQLTLTEMKNGHGWSYRLFAATQHKPTQVQWKLNRDENVEMTQRLVSHNYRGALNECDGTMSVTVELSAWMNRSTWSAEHMHLFFGRRPHATVLLLLRLQTCTSQWFYHLQRLGALRFRNTPMLAEAKVMVACGSILRGRSGWSELLHTHKVWGDTFFCKNRWDSTAEEATEAEAR